eukprot:SAG22_NODE_4_length_44774_cov_362.122149_48_plen_57_part_00
MMVMSEFTPLQGVSHCHRVPASSTSVVGIWGFVTQSQIPNLLLENKKGFLQKIVGR